MKLTVDNIYCYVKKLPDMEYRDFSRMSAIIDRHIAPSVPGAWFSPKYKSGQWDGKFHFFDFKNYRFPSGLLHRAVAVLEKEQQHYEVVDNRTAPSIEPLQPESVTIKGVTLRDYQREAAKACIDSVRGVLGAATNSGKTEVACAIMKCLPVKSIFLTHRAELFKQTIKTINKRLGEKVGVLGQGREERLDARIVVAMIPTLYARLAEKTEWLKEFEMFICDEFHHGSANSYGAVCNKCYNAYYRFGLSGTPDGKGDLDKMKMEAISGPVVYRISNQQLIDLGVSSKPTIHLVEQNDPAGWWESPYMEAVVNLIDNNESRNRKICEIAMHSNKQERQCLIIVNHIAHGDNIKNIFDKEFKATVPFIHGSSEGGYRTSCLEQFAEGDISILIASTILKEGINVPTIGSLIYACAGRSKTSLLQTIGRSLRLNEYGNKVEVYDFMDYTNEHLAAHSAARLHIMQQEGFPIKFYEAD